MKKLLSLILCIVLVCTALVSCKKENLENFLEKYRNNSSKTEATETLNFYIITGNGTGESAKTTVPQNINTYLKDKYNVELVINYFTEAEYNAKVLAALDTTVESERPDIILINGADMFDAVKDELVPLNTADFNFYGTDYKRLKSIVKQSILTASAENGVYYTVPNNHNVGEYKYVVFDQKIAQQIGYTIDYTFDGQGTPVATVNTLAAVEEFKLALAAKDPTLDPDKYIRVVTGDYATLETLKKFDLSTDTDAKKVVNHVNILSYPNATREEAHLSAFAIVKHLEDPGVYEKGKDDDVLERFKSHYNKRMQIIYALNTDATFKNLLQYGVVGTNYTHELDKLTNEPTDVVNLVAKDNPNRYEMKHIHTGDPFASGLYYCNDEEFGWDKATESSWLKQIAEAKMPSEKISTELSGVLSALGVTSDSLSVNGGTTITVPTKITTYGDVIITWSAPTEGTTVNGNDITFNNANAEVDITINLTCFDVTVTKVIKVTVTKTEA